MQDEQPFGEFGHVGDVSGLPVDKNEVGEMLYASLEARFPSLAAKLVGMMLELDVQDLHKILTCQQTLEDTIQEALQVLGDEMGENVGGNGEENPEGKLKASHDAAVGIYTGAQVGRAGNALKHIDAKQVDLEYEVDHEGMSPGSVSLSSPHRSISLMSSPYASSIESSLCTMEVASPSVAIQNPSGVTRSPSRITSTLSMNLATPIIKPETPVMATPTDKLCTHSQQNPKSMTLIPNAHSAAARTIAPTPNTVSSTLPSPTPTHVNSHSYNPSPMQECAERSASSKKKSYAMAASASKPRSIHSSKENNTNQDVLNLRPRKLFEKKKSGTDARHNARPHATEAHATSNTCVVNNLRGLCSLLSCKALGAKITRVLREPKRALIDLVVREIGTQKAIEICMETADILSNGGMARADGKGNRTPGGVFLTILRKHVSAEAYKDFYKKAAPRGTFQKTSRGGYRVGHGRTYREKPGFTGKTAKGPVRHIYRTRTPRQTPRKHKRTKFSASTCTTGRSRSRSKSGSGHALRDGVGDFEVPTNTCC
ncbi:hypothetical protein AAMO2058_000916100 [Amorphochlora amoebiformis]